MFGFEPNQKAILHLTWMAFFLTFAAWFNLAPFNTTLMATEGLTEYQVRMLMVANVALTIPARVFIGSLVDRFGPKRVFVWILLLAAGASFLFAAARTFNGLLASRLMMGVVGAGFVVGIKIIADWFPPQKMGTAQGLYAGWGNFGAAAAAFSLPPLAAFYSLDMGWRVAAGVSGLLCLIWSGVYHLWARDVPATVNPLRLGLEHSIPVSSRRDLWLQMILLGPVYAAMGMLFWRLAEAVAPPLGSFGLEWAWVGIGAAYIWHAWVCFRFNQERLQKPPLPENRYPFKQIVILSLVYALTFGSELAVISMFPEFLERTFSLSVTQAGILGSSFAFFNIVTRPSGGWLADRWGRRRTLFILVAGSTLCYWTMGGITARWPAGLAVGLAVLCSILIQAGNGACFSMVPLIRRDLTGQMAGMAGAYGTVGAVLFLTVLSFVDPAVFFKTIAGYGLLVTVCVLFLDSFKELHVSFNPANRN